MDSVSSEQLERLNRTFFKSFVVHEFIEAAHFFHDIHTSMPLLHEKNIKDLAQEFADAGRDAEEYWEARQCLDGRFQYGMPRVLHWSYLIFLCSLMESKIFTIASILASQKNVSLEEWLDPADKKKAPRGSYIEKYRRFIKMHSNLDISRIAEWSFLGELTCIRNCMVHRGGRLPKRIDRRKQLQDIARKFDGFISADPNWDRPLAKLTVTDGFCKLASIKLCDFFNIFHDELVKGPVIPIKIYSFLGF